MTTPPTAKTHPASVETPQTSTGTRTGNLTFETPLLLVALVAFATIVLALPEVALLLLGIPAAVVLGVTTLTSVARLLAR